MTSEEFVVGDWIDRLAPALARLAEAQEPYLREYQERCARVIVLKDGEPPPFPLDDVRMVYAAARHSRVWGVEAQYARLRAVLDPVRHALLGHPTLERVAVTGRLIGDNEFWMRILESGSSISAGDLIAGLMARAAEVPDDGFRTALRELNALLSPAGDEAVGVLGSLDEGCDVLLFYGLTVIERIEVADGMALLPYGEVLRFVEQELVEEFAPRSAGFHGWRPVGAVVRLFRWRPEFRSGGRVDEPVGPLPPPFFREAAAFLDLLAVSHATPVMPLAMLSNRIDVSAGRLLGREKQSPGFYQSWTAQGFSGFDECPALRSEGFEEAQEALRVRESKRYTRMAPIVTRLSEALVRNGRFAVADRILDVAMALERMYVLDEGKIGRKLRNRTARFLGTDAASEKRINDNVKELYDVRSDIVHNRLHKLTPDRVHSAFVKGFDIARRSLFKLLREGPPDEW